MPVNVRLECRFPHESHFPCDKHFDYVSSFTSEFVLFLLSFFSLAEFMPQVKVEQVETVEGCSHEVKKICCFLFGFLRILFIFK